MRYLPRFIVLFSLCFINLTCLNQGFATNAIIASNAEPQVITAPRNEGEASALITEISPLDKARMDPANIGMTISAIQDEIARIDAKGAEANEADKSSKIDYQAILALDDQIINFNQKTQMITKLISGDDRGMQKDDTYTPENIEAYLLEIDNQILNLKHLSLDNLLGEQAGLTNFIEGAQKEQARFESYLESINALPKDFQSKSSELTDKIIANRNSLSGMAMGTDNASLRLRLSAEITAAQTELSFSQFVISNSNIFYERLRTRINLLKQTTQKLNVALNKISRRITTIKQTQVLAAEKDENAQILEQAQDNVLIKAIAQDNNQLIARLNQGFENTKSYNEQNKQLTKLIDRAHKVESDIENQIKYFEHSVFLSQILFNQRYIIPDFVLPNGLSEKVGELRMEIYGYGVELEQLFEQDQFISDFITNKGLPYALWKDYKSVKNEISASTLEKKIKTKSIESTAKETQEKNKTIVNNNKTKKQKHKNTNSKATQDLVVKQNDSKTKTIDAFKAQAQTNYVVEEQQKINFLQNIKRLLELRAAILTRLYSETTVEVNSAINVMVSYDKYVKLKENLNEQIYERMFWSPSNNSLLSADWYLKLPSEINRQFNFTQTNLSRLSWHQPRLGVILISIPLFVLIVVLVFLRGTMHKKVEEINGRLSSFVTDSQLNTPKVIVLTVLGTLWFPLLIFTIGGITLSSLEIAETAENADKIIDAFWGLFVSVSLCLWGRNFLMCIFSPRYRIAEKHFGLNVQSSLLKCIKRILTVFCITLLLCTWKVEEPQTLAVDVLGQITLIVLYAYIFFEFLLWEILIWKKQSAIGGLFINLIPLVLSGVIFILMVRGYYYSGASITLHFVASIFACFAYLIISNMIARSMKLVSRRINYKRWQESRKNASSNVIDEHVDHEGEILDIAEKEMSTSEMSNQTLVIVRYVLLSILCVVLYHIWSGLLSVTSYFEYISLYDIKAQDNSVLRTVSLMDLIFVIYGVIITFVFLKNMPGVLEVLIFNRFKKLDTYGYSIITLCNYICIGVASVFCLSRLGISWSELQWMVAALSVGLGFGLQEIFANFISGIIILFERPIRIGDIITINNNSGVVSKIRIRATTIVNFDYKEYVVPNKEFITNAIVNWSLNDTMTRIVIEIGVGYGSSLEEVREVLYRLADENPYTLKDPAPSVLFLSFGDSNLNLELRVYVKKISDRNTCIDSLNTQIYNEFNRLGIEIAFNQMDVFIKNVHNGQEIRVQDKDNVLENNLMNSHDDNVQTQTHEEASSNVSIDSKGVLPKAHI